jgi:hypothetical protein
MIPIPRKKLPAGLEDWCGSLRCIATGFTAFLSAKEIEDYFKKLPACSVTHKWQCAKCNRWHYMGATRGPSGESSGGDKRKIEAAEKNAETFEKIKRRGFILEEQQAKSDESKLGRFKYL